MIFLLNATREILKLGLSLFLVLFLTNCEKDVKPTNDQDELVEYTGFLKIPGVGFQTFLGLKMKIQI